LGIANSRSQVETEILLEIEMQNEIEILETREAPCILWA